MSRTAIFPGSFDPVTLGHQDVLEQAKNVFVQVWVTIAKNGSKTPTFTEGEREIMWNMVRHFHVYVPLGPESIVESARRCGAKYIVRGIRGPEDLAGEQAYRQFVEQASGGEIQVVHFLTPGRLNHISSTAVRQILQLGDRDLLNGWADARLHEFLLTGKR